MAHVTFKGSEVQLTGCVPAVGDVAPAFTLTGADLGDVSLSDFKGKRVVLSIFPSIDTPVCAASVRHFNVDASTMKNAVVLCISADLPFAQARFCGAEGLQNVKTLSTFRSPEFGSAYGIQIAAGPLRGLLSRAVVIVDEQGRIAYVDVVAEVTNEPNYAAALNLLK